MQFKIIITQNKEKTRRSSWVGLFDVCVALRMPIMHFLANRNTELAVPPLFWPVNCIKIGGHVELPSYPTVHSLYCDCNDTCSTLCNIQNTAIKFGAKKKNKSLFLYLGINLLTYASFKDLQLHLYHPILSDCRLFCVTELHFVFDDFLNSQVFSFRLR